MPNILINPNSGIIEFSTGVAGGAIFDANITSGNRAVRLGYDNFGGINISSYVNITGSGFASGQDRFSVDGANGRLFSVTDNLAGSLFSVNDIAGLPIIEAFDDNTVIMGAYNKNDFVLTGNALGIGGLPNTGVNKLYISGYWSDTGIYYTGIDYNIRLASGFSLSSNNKIFNLGINSTGVFYVNGKGQVLITQPAGPTAYDNTFEVKKGATSLFKIRDDGATEFGLGGSQALLFGGSVYLGIKNGGLVTANGGFLGFSNSADPINFPAEHTVRLYRGNDFVLDLRNVTYPTSGHQFRIFNLTGTNSGEFGLLGWQNNQFIVGAQATSSGTLRSTIITGNNIILSPSGNVGILNNNPQYPLDVSGSVRIGGVYGTAGSIQINNGISINNQTVNGFGAAGWNAGGSISIGGVLVNDGANLIGIRNGANPQQLRIYNITGTNTGEYSSLSWQNNQFVFGPQATNSGILRNLIVTGSNIILSPSGNVGILNNNPQYQIDVSGTGKFTSEIVTTQNFTSGSTSTIAVYQYYNASTQSLDTVFN